MKTKAPVLLTLLAASLWMCSPSAAASDLLFSQNADGQSTYGPSQLWSASNVNSEIADDFNVVANIDRVYASGFIWGAVNFQGVYVRFYQYGADNKPGALQREYFLAAGGPNVRFDQLSGAIDTTLRPLSLPPAGIFSPSNQSSTIGTGGAPISTRRADRHFTSAITPSVKRGITATTSTLT